MRTETFGKLQVRLAGGSDREGGGPGPLLVLMHGFGAPGDDLVALWRQLATRSGLRFAFPAAPLSLGEISPMSDARAWWHIDVLALERALAAGTYRDMSLTEPAGLPEARELVLGALDEIERKLAPSRIILGGFSQGAMLAMEIALKAPRDFAGFVTLSPTLLAEPRWRTLAEARAPARFFMSHGRQDPLLPFALSEQLCELLRAAGHEVRFVPFNGGHEIPQGVLDGLAQFLEDCLVD